MTTGTDRDGFDWRRSWAAEQLGVVADAPPAEVRAALLRRLPEAGFVPPPAWRRACRVLSGEAVHGAVDEDVRLAHDDRLRAEVEEFTRGYWGLAPEQRRRRWETLRAGCSSPPLTARLEALEAGLDAAAEPGGIGREGPELAELAALIRSLFVLRPAERALARQEFLLRVRRQPHSWERAAKRLRRRYSNLAALDPGLVGELLDWRSRRKRAERGRTRINQGQVQAAARSQNSGAGRAGVGVLVGVAVVLARLASGGLSHNSDLHRAPTPAWQAPVPSGNWQQTPAIPLATNDDFVKKLIQGGQADPTEPRQGAPDGWKRWRDSRWPGAGGPRPQSPMDPTTGRGGPTTPSSPERTAPSDSPPGSRPPMP
jgi:hypothetical protein